MRKKKKPDFQTFKHNDKSAYKTLKIPLKSILRDRHTVQPVINQLVFDINELVIHSYQFIRLYILDCYHRNQPLPNINETFVLYCIKTLGTRDNRGRQCADTELAENLQIFYETEYQPLLNHEKIALKNTTFLLPYVSSQIFTCLSNNAQEHFI